MTRFTNRFSNKVVRRVRCAAICAALAASLQCGFLAETRLSEAYVEEALPDDEVTCLVTWPVHVIGLSGAAVIDQGIRTFTAVPPAGRDAWDYFQLRGSGNNLMLERTIAAPKAIGTPLVFVGSYIFRWFLPIDAEDRPFEGLDREERDRPEATEKLEQPPSFGESEAPGNLKKPQAPEGSQEP